MSDPSQLSSSIAELEARTVGLNADGTAAFTYIAGSVDAAVVGAGTDSGSAFPLAASINIITGGDSASGVILPDLSGLPGADILVFANASAKTIYPPTADQIIDGGTPGDGVALSANKRCAYWMVDSLNWVSAQLGAVSS